MFFCVLIHQRRGKALGNLAVVGNHFRHYPDIVSSFFSPSAAILEYPTEFRKVICYGGHRVKLQLFAILIYKPTPIWVLLTVIDINVTRFRFKI